MRRRAARAPRGDWQRRPRPRPPPPPPKLSARLVEGSPEPGACRGGQTGLRGSPPGEAGEQCGLMGSVCGGEGGAARKRP